MPPQKDEPTADSKRKAAPAATSLSTKKAKTSREESTAAGPFKLPEGVREVLSERMNKLRSGIFPEETDIQEALLARRLEDMLEKDLSNDPYPHRLAADLAIVASRVAHAMDKKQDWSSSGDSDEYAFQENFRRCDWLADECNFRSSILRPNTIERAMEAVQRVQARALKTTEKTKFIEWHRKACYPDAPLLDGEKMEAFLNAQQIYSLPLGTNKLRLHGFSSFDGTCIYVVHEGNGATIPHELEHNIRRYIIEADAQEQARLVSPAKDPSLRIETSKGVSLQCEAGFVMEKKNGQVVPYDLISPFSARWCSRCSR